MKTLAELMKQWAQEDGIKDPQVSIDEKNDNAEYAFSAAVGEEDFSIFLNGFESDRSIMLAMYHQHDLIAQERVGEVARLLNRINDQKLKRGNFEITCEGRIRFRDQIASIGDDLPFDTMEGMIEQAMCRFGDALPTIRKVAFGGLSVDSAMVDRDDIGEFNASTLPDARDASSWQQFPGAAVIQHWAASVRAALAGSAVATHEDWRLIGPAIAIEHPYCRIGEALAHCIAADCGIPLHVVTANNLPALKDNQSAFEAIAPVLVYLEADQWQTIKDTDADDASEARSQVIALLKAFNPAHPVFVVTVTCSYEDMAPPLRRHGTFDRCFELPRITPLALGKLFLELIGSERCAPSLTQAPAKVGKLLYRNFDAPELRKLAALRMRRKHAQTGRPLEFLDLVNMDSQGLPESDSICIEDEALRQRVAWHEAGHAAMALLDSAGKDIPEFTSIVPHGSANGVVVNSVDYHSASSTNQTYSDLCHAIRVSLAGRAAEEVIYGSAGIGDGSRSDLVNSVRLAADAFAFLGFVPGMEGNLPSEGNLAVILGNPTPSEYAHLEILVRDFLAQQYRIVREQLANNRPLLATIQTRLMKTAILDQQEMAQLYAEVCT